MTRTHPRPPADCPVCGVAVTVTRLTCEACGTELTGRFSPCGLCGLSDDDVALVRAVMAAGADLHEVARRTGFGPEVLEQRLRAAAAHLGHDDAPSAPLSALPDDPAEPRDDFLERLARGVVEADEALRHLP